jgi:hypothetical protein
MDDDIDELIVSVRADTQAFAADMQQMRGSFDGTLVDGFEKAGDVLERGLVSAIRKGSLGFDDLKRTATAVLDQIAAQALQLGLDSLFGGKGGQAGGFGGLFQGALGALFGGEIVLIVVEQNAMGRAFQVVELVILHGPEERPHCQPQQNQRQRNQ